MAEGASKEQPPLRAIPLEQARSARGQTLIAMPRSKVAGLRAFRRIRSDRFVGFLGLIFLFLAVVLVWKWPPAPVVVAPSYGIEWLEARTPFEAETHRLSFPGGPSTTTPPPPEWTRTYALESEVNITAFFVSLSWKDDVASPDQTNVEGDVLELEIQPPATVKPANSSASTVVKIRDRAGSQNVKLLNYTMPLSGVPSLSNVPASNEADARKLAAQDPQTKPNLTGQGSWKIIVRLLEAPDDWNDESLRGSGAPCQAPACRPDDGNDFTLNVAYSKYSIAFKSR